MGGLSMKLNFSSCARHTVCLTVLLTVLCTALVVVKAFMPMFILPRITITLLIALSLGAQVMQYWIFPGGDVLPEYLETALLTAVVFAALTWAVGLADLPGACRVGIYGGILYAVCLLVFRAMEAQLASSGVKRKGLALTGAALLLLLASQSLAGIPVLA